MTRRARAAAPRAGTEAFDAAREAWLAARGWRAFDFQREVWDALARGESGLLHASTGSGKTLAVWLGALRAFGASTATAQPKAHAARPPTPDRLTVLWITPMRALAADSVRALSEPLAALGPEGAGVLRAWDIGLRTGDSSSAERSAQARRLPSVLVTTPESLSLLIARADAAEALGGVRLVVVDEWHELMGSKRGVQVELALARLRAWNPSLLTWGMSATLGNLAQAERHLWGQGRAGRRVEARVDKTLVVDTLLPPTHERFPWAGHLGLTLLPQVVAEIEGSSTSLIFTNTRSQAELWYQALLEARPDWAASLALHHGSLDRATREWVEAGLKQGQLRAVVCTSSLDLGVDFLPVERVLQIGSPKGVARLLQRAGRSGHAPGRPSRVTVVPTHSLELIEGAAARAAVAAGQVESREPPEQPLDVLVQHLVTVALGGGFEPAALLREVRGTAAYAALDDGAWQWCLDFVRQGGASLSAYPDYHRVRPDEQGVWRVPDARLARRHRVNIGTIVSDASMSVQYVAGGAGRIGSVEEGFIARLRPGDCFLFGGRLLELVRVHQMTAYVRRATGRRAAVPRWNGGRMPLSTTLAEATLRELARAAAGQFDSPELTRARPLLELQQRWSALPTPTSLLAETLHSRDGWHLFLYPFAGRQVHLGVASLLAWRAAQLSPGTFSMAVNDYGLELLSATPFDWAAHLPSVLAPVDDDTLLAQVLGSLNAGELAQRRFREIARVAGLIFQSHPGEQRSQRQLQASSSLFYEVFRKYDPANRLLVQAERELLSQELEIGRLRRSLHDMTRKTLTVRRLERPTPFAFPLLVERLRERLTNESLADRIARLLEPLEAAAGAQASVEAGLDVMPSVQARVAFGLAPDEPVGRRVGPRGAAGARQGAGRPRRPRRPRM